MPRQCHWEECIPKVEDCLRHVSGPSLSSLGVTVAKPNNASKKPGLVPYLAAGDSFGEVGVKAVVVDALPYLVWGTSRATTTARVEGELAGLVTRSLCEGF